VLLTTLVMGAPFSLRAQLISPGKLTRAHADLEGIRNCRNCHQLRRKGIDPERCLECHTPLAQRLAQGNGLHATFRDQSCGDCHKEHGGVDLDIIRFDTTGFAHREAGFVLRGKHQEASCRSCHQPDLIEDAAVRSFKAEHDALDETFLGLGTECLSCHRPDDPHGGQFADRTCTECHQEEGWQPTVGFDHDRTDYPLTGRHRQVACASCHRDVTRNGITFAQYRDLPARTCRTCHQDPHDGAMGRRCEQCHVTGGWTRINRNRFESDFDHSRTRFALQGAHADLECVSCHDAARHTEGIRLQFRRGSRRRRYPMPAFATCTSCHVDYHEGAFANLEAAASCDGCHSLDAWWPSSFDIDRHDAETDFTLRGAHVALPCASCHLDAATDPPTPHFRFEDTTCIACHEADDPHAGQFADRPCESCHTTETFAITDFDHTRTRFPLDGAHEDVECEACHRQETDAEGRRARRFVGVPLTCRECHGA